ncbi:2235_t:CDS:2, partial [Funneliformis geosporum]
MAGMVWTFDAIEDLINLHNDYRVEFENALNIKHAAMVHGYENSRRIRVENPEGFSIR